MKQSKILSVLLAVLMACLVLSSSVAVPISAALSITPISALWGWSRLPA